MKLTSQRIISDVMSLLKDTPIATNIGGSMYRGGLRPRDSVKEDLIVIYTEANAGQFQTGVVTINVYVPDIRIQANGVLVPNSARLEMLEDLCQQSVDRLTASRSNYLFSLKEAIHTNHDDEINQSFVVARLGFTHYM